MANCREGAAVLLIYSIGCFPATPHPARVPRGKAMLREGVVIEPDLEKDLGLKGAYSLSVSNPVLAGAGVGP